MEKYSYNNTLIEKLNLLEFIEKYNLINENYNTVIFCALSSIFEHYKKKDTQNINTKSILLGDYYSFEYYNLLQKDLVKLKQLTDVIKDIYLEISYGREDINSFIQNIVTLWLDFYDLKFQDSDKMLLTSL